MKQLLILSLLLYSLTGFSQGFPFYATQPLSISGNVTVIDNRPLTTYRSLDDMIKNEGQRRGYKQQLSLPVTGTVVTSVAATTATTGFVTYNVGSLAWGSAVVEYGFAAELIDGLIAINNYQASGGYLFNPRPSGTAYLNDGKADGVWAVGAGGGVYTVQGAGAISNRDRFGLSSFVERITEPWSSTSVPAIGSTKSFTLTGSAGYNLKRFTDDKNYTAPYIGELVVDSKITGFGNTTGAKDMFYSYFNNYWKDKGYDFRTRNGGVTGSTAQQHELEQSEGLYNYPAKSIITIFDVTTNNYADVPDSVANSVARFAIRHTAQNPKEIFVVLATYPRNDGNEALSATVSAAVATKIGSLTATYPRIKFCPATRTAYTATDATNYVDGLHWSPKGALAAWTAVKNWLITNVPTLPLPY